MVYGRTVLAYSELGNVMLVGWHSPSERAMPIVSFAQHQSNASWYSVQLGSAHVRPAFTMEPQSSAAGIIVSECFHLNLREKYL